MYPVVLEIGNFDLRSYGVIVAACFLLAVWLSMKEARGNGLERQVVYDFAVYTLIGGLIGARLYFVLFSQPAYFLQNPLGDSGHMARRNGRHRLVDWRLRRRIMVLPRKKPLLLAIR